MSDTNEKAEPRTERLQLVFTPTEMKAIKDYAQKAGVGTAEAIREGVLRMVEISELAD